MHALCSTPQRASVRAVLMLHKRTAESTLLARLPTEVLLAILRKLPIETEAEAGGSTRDGEESDTEVQLYTGRIRGEDRP